jgi:hypothetical protein
MRPLTKPAVPTRYAEPALAVVVSTGRGQPDMAIQEIYDFFTSQDWIALENQDPKNAATTLLIARKNRYITKVLSKIYTGARFDLIASLDEVCAYCGMPLRGDIAVEHIQPKSLFPLLMLRWDNFLPACRDCNSRKQNRPTNQGNDLLINYIWPHTSLKKRMFGCGLYLYDQVIRDRVQATPDPAHASPVEMPHLIELIATKNIVITLPTADEWAVLATTYDGDGHAAQHKMAVLIRSVQSAQAQQTIDTLLKLNSYTADNSASDRRLIERTQVWLLAVQAMYGLIAIRDAPLATRTLLIQQIQDTILMTGFWHVWVEVFVIYSGLFINLDDRNAILTFLRTAFAGTNQAELFF